MKRFSRPLFRAAFCGLSVFAITQARAQVAAPAQEAAAATPLALQNPGFEDAFAPVASKSDADNKQAQISGETAIGWTDNSNWADVGIEYARDTSNPHRGKAAQHITVKRVSSGAVQFAQSVGLKRDHVYQVRAWLRGIGGANFSLRQAGAPYGVYGSSRVDLSPEWREFSATGIVNEDTPGFVMLIAQEPMSVYIDDVSIVDLTSAIAGARARRGNLIGSGSFEAGMSFGWSTRFEGRESNKVLDPQATIDTRTAAVGHQSLRADILPGDSVRIASPAWTFNFNRRHTASVWLKASAPDLDVRLSLATTDINQWVRVGTQWKRFTLSATPPYRPFSRLDIFVNPIESGATRTLWVDGAQVEESATASPQYLPAAPMELTLDLARPGKVVFDDEKAQVTIGAASATGDATQNATLPRGARVRLSMQNIYGATRALPDLMLPASSFALPTFAGRTRGVFKLRGQIVDAGGKALSAPVEMVWARLPRPRDIAPERSYFGTHIPLSPDYVRLMRAIGHRWVRLHDTSMTAKWAIMEPQPGQYEFNDKGVAAAKSGGLAILGMLDGAPARVSTKPREGGYWGIWNVPDKPGALPQWENYVRTAVGHYKGSINYWEIWNEPWGQWWLDSGNANATPALYAQLMKTAYSTAKSANPNARILGVDTFRGYETRWTAPVLAASGLDAFDILSFHDYNDAMYGGPNNFAMNQAKTLSDLQRPHGAPKPLWDTEGGLFGVGSFYSPEWGGMGASAQVAYMIRYDVSQMASGVEKFFIYAIHSNPAMGDNETRLTEHDRAIRPLLAARAVLASLVDGAGTPVRSEPIKGVDLYTFPIQNGKVVSVLWSYDNAPHIISIPRGARALDAMGNSMTMEAPLSAGAEPIYFVR